MFLKSSAFFAATLLGAKSAFCRIADSAGLPEGKLSLFNTNTRERLTVTYRDSLGEYCDEALQALNWLFRCHNTDEATAMDETQRFVEENCSSSYTVVRVFKA